MGKKSKTSYISIERIASGIPGLDDLMEGGFIKGSTNLLAGNSGTCKTIMGCQYIWEGIQRGEKGLYITLEESKKDIIEDVARFGWDFQKCIDEGKCKIVKMKSVDLKELISFMENETKSIGADRFVLDSLSIASMSWKGGPDEVFKIRADLFDMLKRLKSLDVTSILISEIKRGEQSFGRFGFEEFLVDGLLILQLMVTDRAMRSLQIMKMRRTDHSVEIYPFTITDKGIVIKKI